MTSQRNADVDELATTGRFVRAYDRVEIKPQRKFVHTIRRRDPDGQWFDPNESALLAIEEPIEERRESWWWLAISLAAGGAAIAMMAQL